MSVEVIAKEVISFGGSVAFGAGAAALLSSPVGAAGGAVYGAFSYLLGRPISYITEKAFNADQKDASSISKLVSAVAGFFAGSAAAWGVTNAIGFNWTYGSAIILSLTTSALVLATVSAVGLAALAIIACRASASSMS